MTPSKDIEAAETAELAATQAAIDAIEASQQDEFTDDDVIQTPLLKVGQQLTQEVKDGDAESGEFINTLTGDVLGDKIEFVVAYYHRGRFASDDKAGTFVSSDDLIPESWSPLVGDAFVGTPFEEYPDAEETYRKRVNAGEIEWASGPLVSTTYNFVGFVFDPNAAEDADVTERLQPVRLSLQRTNKKAADKIKTLKKAVLRNKPFWEKVITMRTDERQFGRNSAFVIDPTSIRFVRNTTPDEKSAAVQLAQAVMGGRVTEAPTADDESAQRAAAPEKAEGGIDIG